MCRTDCFKRAEDIAPLLKSETLHLYICGLRGMEDGAELALSDIARARGVDWRGLRAEMCETGRFHIETY